MKKIFENCFGGLFITVMLCTSLLQSTYTMSNFIKPVQLTSMSGITRAEETGYKYKLMNGKLYKRLWSYTYGKWIDDDWILVE